MNPAAGVVLGKDGVIYGTTERGVTADGTVFTLTPPTKPGGSWHERILHFFVNNGTGGAFPSGLVLDIKGDLYGPTPAGGVYGAGEIFQLKAPKKGERPWIFTTLYNFLESPDGDEPTGDLTFDGSGNLYGITSVGGTGPCQGGGCGTVFEFNP